MPPRASTSSSSDERRTHATRSCLACRKRKVRCQLGNLNVPSSEKPLAEDDACARCNKMGLGCVVWDGNRKGTRYTLKRKAQSRSSTPPTSTNDDILSPFYLLSPTFKATTSQNDATTIVRQTPLPSMTLHRAISMTRRPMFMLVQLLARQGILRCGVVGVPFRHEDILISLLHRYDSSPPAEYCDAGLMALHPHLPRLSFLLAQHRNAPTLASALLLSVMLFLCCAVDKDDEHLHCIKNYGLQVYMRAPRDVQAAQALELIAVHLPFLLEEGEGDGRYVVKDQNHPPPGTTLIGMALNIARAASYDDDLLKQTLLMSLECWETAFKLHEHSSSSLQSSHRTLSEPLDVRYASPIDVFYSFARQALHARYEAMRSTASCIEELQAISTHEPKEFQAQQTISLDRFNQALELLVDRCSLLKHDVQAMLRLEPLGSAVDFVFLWLEFEALALRHRVLGHALSSIYMLVSPDSRVTSISVFWKHPAWTAYTGKVGLQRNEDLPVLLSKACAIGKRARRSRETVFVLPATLFCAFSVAAAKALLDTQLVLLQSWCHVHRDTDIFVLIIARLADVLQQSEAEMDDVMACSGKILRVIADTMSAWQAKQSFVLAKHRLPKEQNGNGQASSDAMLDDEFSVPSIDSLFEGIVELPEWDQMIQMLESSSSNPFREPIS